MTHKIFLVLFFCVVTAFTASAQKVTINLKQVKLERVFDAITQQTGLTVAYSRPTVNPDRIVSIQTDHEELSSVLTRLFSGSNIDFEISKKKIYLKDKSSLESSQSGGGRTKKISGKILDDKGEPVIGASILVQGSNNGTISDINGNYSLADVPESGTLIISYIGYKTLNLPAQGKDLAKIVLQEDTKMIDEVVVVGYGVQRKRDVTTSIASMRASDLDVPVSSLDQAMTGKLAGVQVSQPSGTPGGGVSIKVRGTGSITAGTEPLYVIDGFPMSDEAENGTGMTVNPLSSIDMNDIESIEVLKDASAAAIYGSRGSNGVIIITTKQGKAGKPQVKYDGYVGWQKTTKKIDMLNAHDYAQLVYDSHNNSYLDLLEKKGIIGGSITDTNEQRLERLGVSAGTTNVNYLLPPEIMPYINGEEGLTETDWQDEVMRTALKHSHSLSISGGTKAIKYFISGNYVGEDGIVIGSDFQRMGGRAKVEATYNRLKMGANISMTHTIYNLVPTDNRYKDETIVASALAMAPILPAYNTDGSYNFEQYKWQYGQPQILNPVALAKEKEDQMKRNKLTGSGFAEYEIIKGLKLKTTFGVDLNSYRRNQYRPSTLPTKINKTPPSIPEGTTRTKDLLSWVWENTLTYSRKFKKKHNVNAMIGWTAQKEAIDASRITGTGFPNDLVHTLNASTVATNWDSSRSEWSLLSALGRIQYDYRNRYMLSAAIRADGSSRFGKNNRWGTFPSLSAGWYITEEKFMKDIKWLTSLKLRASYGISGNFSIGNYEYYSALNEDNYVFGSGDGILAPGLYTSTEGNPDLGWEKTAMVNIGLEAGFWNMFNIEFDIYNSNTSDMLLNVPVPQFSGFNTVRKNIGKVNNKGFELTLSSNNRWGDFAWNNSLNFSMNRNKVKDLGGVNEIVTTVESVMDFVTRVGEPIGNYYTLVTDGVFKNQEEINIANDINDKRIAKVEGAKPGDFKYKDMNGDGIINSEDKTITGNYMPDFTYGFSTNVKYKIFDFSVAFQGTHGGEIANLYRRYIDNMEGGANVMANALNRWTSEENPGNGQTIRANRTATGKNGEISTWHIEDGSYLRIRDITFGVTMPKVWMKQMGISNLRLYFSAFNPFTFTKYSGYNPEVDMKNNPLTPGIDYGTYPLSKSCVFGVNLSF